MTCKQLGGPCNAPIQGRSARQIIENGKRHGMEMVEKGDQEHIKIIEEMKNMQSNPEVVKKWNETMAKEFEALPED